MHKVGRVCRLKSNQRNVYNLKAINMLMWKLEVEEVAFMRDLLPQFLREDLHNY